MSTNQSVIMQVKAAVLVAPGKISIEYFPRPNVSDGDALVRMIGSGICGTDKHVFLKGEIRLGLVNDIVRFPIILGHENIGIIEEITNEAKKSMTTDGVPLDVGERVVISADIRCGRCYNCINYYGVPWCENHRSYGDVISCKDPPHLFGGMAEMMYVLKGSYMFRIPKRLSNKIAILTEPLAVAYGAFVRGFQNPMTKEGFAPADFVLIQGAGPLGFCNALMAQLLGSSRIIVLDKSPFRLKIVKELLNVETINISEESPQDRLTHVLSITEGRGADVVVECTGSDEAFSEGLSYLRIGGTYLIEGAYAEGGMIQISPSRQIVAKNVRIIGIAGMPYQAYARVLKILNSLGDINRLERVVTHIFDIDHANEAMHTSIKYDSMKVVVGSMKD